MFPSQVRFTDPEVIFPLMREVWPLCGNESDRFPMLLSAYLLKQDQLSKSFSGHPWKVNVVEVDNAPLVEAISESPDAENN